MADGKTRALCALGDPPGFLLIVSKEHEDASVAMGEALAEFVNAAGNYYLLPWVMLHRMLEGLFLHDGLDRWPDDIKRAAEIFGDACDKRAEQLKG